MATAAAIRAELAPQIQAFQTERGRAPSLHIMLVGDDPASQVYVRNKERAGRDAGLAVTDAGRLFIRNIAMRFDAYLRKQTERKFSRTI